MPTRSRCLLEIMNLLEHCTAGWQLRAIVQCEAQNDSLPCIACPAQREELIKRTLEGCNMARPQQSNTLPSVSTMSSPACTQSLEKAEAAGTRSRRVVLDRVRPEAPRRRGAESLFSVRGARPESRLGGSPRLRQPCRTPVVGGQPPHLPFLRALMS